MSDGKPRAFLHFVQHTGRWIAYDWYGKVVAEDWDKNTVIRMCVQAGFQVVEPE